MSLLPVNLTSEIHYCAVQKKFGTNGSLLCLLAYQGACCPPSSSCIISTHFRAHADVLGLLNSSSLLPILTLTSPAHGLLSHRSSSLAALLFCLSAPLVPSRLVICVFLSLLPTSLPSPGQGQSTQMLSIFLIQPLPNAFVCTLPQIYNKNRLPNHTLELPLQVYTTVGYSVT